MVSTWKHDHGKFSPLDGYSQSKYYVFSNINCKLQNLSTLLIIQNIDILSQSNQKTTEKIYIYWLALNSFSSLIQSFSSHLILYLIFFQFLKQTIQTSILSDEISNEFFNSHFSFNILHQSKLRNAFAQNTLNALLFVWLFFELFLTKNSFP